MIRNFTCLKNAPNPDMEKTQNLADFHLLRQACCRTREREALQVAAFFLLIISVSIFPEYCIPEMRVIYKTRWRTNTIRLSLCHPHNRGRGESVTQLLQSPKLSTFKEPRKSIPGKTIPAAYVTWRANTTTLFIALHAYYLHYRMAESIPGFLKRLQIRALG